MKTRTENRQVSPKFATTKNNLHASGKPCPLLKFFSPCLESCLSSIASGTKMRLSFVMFVITRIEPSWTFIFVHLFSRVCVDVPQRILCHSFKVYVRLADGSHFWQNDRDLLRATAVTLGCNGYGKRRRKKESSVSWSWRRIFSRRSCGDSKLRPFDHESSAQTTELSPPPTHVVIFLRVENRAGVGQLLGCETAAWVWDSCLGPHSPTQKL